VLFGRFPGFILLLIFLLARCLFPAFIDVFRNDFRKLTFKVWLIEFLGGKQRLALQFLLFVDFFISLASSHSPCLLLLRFQFDLSIESSFFFGTEQS